ncbi:hypothetical protein FRB99_003467, partial [Tulasnella sp. 403]
MLSRPKTAWRVTKLPAHPLTFPTPAFPVMNTQNEPSSSQPNARPQDQNATRTKGHRRPKDASPEVQISKACSYILRHGALKEGIRMRTDGFVKVSDLLSRPRLQKLGCDFEKLREIVTTNDKKRYSLVYEPSAGEQPGLVLASALNEDGEHRGTNVIDNWWIKANQGHSLEFVELEMTEIKQASDIPMAVHGTTLLAWDSIKQQGLSRMQRNHIHMAKGLSSDEDVISGMRKDSTVYIFVDVEKALAEGIRFFVSENGVVLSPGDEEGIIPVRLF